MSNWVNCWEASVVATAMLISSQAAQAAGSTPARGAEGSETRSRAEAVMDPRVPSTLRGEDIVRYSGENRRAGLNSQRNICMSLVRPAHGNAIAQETVNGTMHLLRSLERALFYGDSSLSSLQFDGYEKLITDNSPATNIIDLRGQPLSEDALQDGALTIHDAPNYGEMSAALAA